MADAPECTQELAFFGRVTAGVTHELKNYLALINEYNGLLSDLVMAHAMGRELDLERLQSLCGDVKRQVTAGGLVLDYLNGFAHSVDQPWQPVELGPWLDLFVGLCRRGAMRHGVELELEPPPAPLTLRTQPFALLRGLWDCLESALGCCQAGDRLVLAAAVERDHLRLSLRGARPAGAGQTARQPAAGLLLALGASFSRREDGCLCLCLPL